MVAPACTEEEFIALWNRLGSVAAVANELGVDRRNVSSRRRNIEKKRGFLLSSVSEKSPDFKVTVPNNGVRTKISIENGTVIVASDCHYWPETVSTAHRALINIIKTVKPRMVVINGDAFDGASISRHPASNWTSLPSVKQELEACQDRLEEIQKAATGAYLHWTWGNHDLRFNARLASQVGDTWKGIEGMNLSDHFPLWRFSTSIMVNDHTMIKHRWHNGIHATYNNALKSGMSIVTGHLHSLKVMPWTDYTGTRYGVDTGTLAEIDGNQFEYAEDNPKNWRSGFAVLTFVDGKLMPPELVEVISEDDGLVFFRGNVITV